ncbi:Zinc-binding dehydrogenase [Phytophthora infestans]|uniref:Zinc-binding dehydrogenase n=1 Tax=Phytophthora infestans TaxID=4787 RepID=A0A833T0C8_PHYIN|nr:Zinc-binding dehydrogenase [Phytophthora infestans]KAF4132893.1 Zinc-binding dehydrogenase [Phytophthora infestans]
MSSIPTTFKAYQFANYSDALTETNEPSRLQAALLWLNGHRTPEKPLGMGMDLSGVIVEVGSGDVRGFKVGDAVFGSADMQCMGSFAEYITLEADHIVHKPSNITVNEAAAGLASYQGLVNRAKVQRGQRVLILGGGSAVGQSGIQIAKAFGAEVITTASSRNKELVKSLGADQVIDYTSEKWVDVLAEHSVDIIYDCAVESESWSTDAQKILKKNSGQFLTIGVVENQADSPIGAKLIQYYCHPIAEDLEGLRKLIEDGKLKTTIDSVYPFDKLLDAIKHQMLGRAQGKIIIEIAKE